MSQIFLLVVAMSLVAFVPVSIMMMVSLGVVDISNVALVAINMVLHSLETAVGKMHMVASTSVLPVSLLIVAKLGAVVGVMDIVAILVVDRVVMVLVAVSSVVFAVVGACL